MEDDLVHALELGKPEGELVLGLGLPDQFLADGPLQPEGRKNHMEVGIFEVVLLYVLANIVGKGDGSGHGQFFFVRIQSGGIRYGGIGVVRNPACGFGLLEVLVSVLGMQAAIAVLGKRSRRDGCRTLCFSGFLLVFLGFLVQGGRLAGRYRAEAFLFDEPDNAFNVPVFAFRVVAGFEVVAPEDGHRLVGEGSGSAPEVLEQEIGGGVGLPGQQLDEDRALAFGHVLEVFQEVVPDLLLLFLEVFPGFLFTACGLQGVPDGIVLLHSFLGQNGIRVGAPYIIDQTKIFITFFDRERSAVYLHLLQHLHRQQLPLVFSYGQRIGMCWHRLGFRQDSFSSYGYCFCLYASVRLRFHGHPASQRHAEPQQNKWNHVDKFPFAAASKPPMSPSHAHKSVLNTPTSENTK